MRNSGCLSDQLIQFGWQLHNYDYEWCEKQSAHASAILRRIKFWIKF